MCTVKHKPSLYNRFLGALDELWVSGYLSFLVTIFHKSTSFEHKIIKQRHHLWRAAVYQVDPSLITKN